MTIVTTRNGEGIYETILSTGSKTFISDEPLKDGGNDKGPSPQELLAASLASCTSITLRMYANRKKWILDDVLVNVEIESDEKHTVLSMIVNVEIKGNLDSVQRVRLVQIAELCPVHKALSKSIPILTKML